jgi:hypothetical protein
LNSERYEAGRTRREFVIRYDDPELIAALSGDYDFRIGSWLTRICTDTEPWHSNQSNPKKR